MHPWLWEVAVLLNREGCYLQFLTAKINFKWRCRLVYGECYFLLRCQPKDTKVQYTHSIISHSTSKKSDAEQVVPINQETAETLNTYCAYNMLELFRNIIFKKNHKLKYARFPSCVTFQKHHFSGDCFQFESHSFL